MPTDPRALAAQMQGMQTPDYGATPMDGLRKVANYLMPDYLRPKPVQNMPAEGNEGKIPAAEPMNPAPWMAMDAASWLAGGVPKAGALAAGAVLPRAVRAAEGVASSKAMNLPKELYHVVGPEYQAGQPLRSLFSRKGNAAYEEFAQRWPEAGDLGQQHAHTVMFYDAKKAAQEHADAFGGKVLQVDPAKVPELYLDTLEKSYGTPGYWATKAEVPPDAFISPFGTANSAAAGIGPAGPAVLGIPISK